MSGTGRLARTLVALVCVVASAAGCARTVEGTGTAHQVPDAGLDVRGDSGDAFDTTVKNALSDVTAYWTRTYPSIADGAPLPPLDGALYSIDGFDVVKTRTLPASAKDNKCLQKAKLFIVDNAAYCQLDDSILWDRSVRHLLPVLTDKYGTALVALVFAHEFGHAIQDRRHLPDSTPVIDSESQADCAAGAFVATALKGGAPHFRLTPTELDSALDGFLQIRDSTPESPDDISHGNGFDRLNALQEGISNGATYCFGETFLESRQYTERGFTDADIFTGGNETLPEVLSKAGGLFPDLNRFWTQAGTAVHQSFDPVQLAEADHPACGANSPTSEFGYCPDDNTVYYSEQFAKNAYFSLATLDVNHTSGNIDLLHDQPADFALGMMIAIGWGMAARHQFFAGSVADRDGLLAAICYAGAYAEDVNLPGGDATHKFVLSPPDMDEATSAVLSLVDTEQAFGARDTSGLERVTSFVAGYDKGLSGC